MIVFIICSSLIHTYITEINLYSLQSNTCIFIPSSSTSHVPNYYMICGCTLHLLVTLMVCSTKLLLTSLLTYPWYRFQRQNHHRFFAQNNQFQHGGCYGCIWRYDSRFHKKNTRRKRIRMWILVNNQLHAQFFIYVYFYSLHVLGSHVPIIRRIIVSIWHLV